MKKKLVLVGISIILLISLVGCDSLFWDGIYNVKYVVSGTAPSVDLTIENKDGGTSQYSDKPIPWEYDFSVSVSQYGYKFVYVSAQNNSSSGSVTSKIYVKKSNENEYSLLKSSTSSGSYVIATASASLTR